MKLHLVNYESSFNDGILTKFAVRLEEELKKLKVKVSVSNEADPKADINHHINYWPYKPNKTKNTLMITHIWEGYKLDTVKEGMKTADKGICMSADMIEYLVEQGIPRKKLAYVLPAHDGLPRKPKVISILTNVYPDGCKREQMFYQLCKVIDKSKFHFIIMGTGWEHILKAIDGLQYTYLGQFDYEKHREILDASEYSLYFGLDEGSMGILDAKNAGQRIITTPVGFNKAMGIDYPFTTQDELNAIFKGLEANPVKDWTWENYARKHCQIWKKLNDQRT